jgi:hypothetical protein
MRYAHIDQQHKREAINKIGRMMDTSMDTSGYFRKRASAEERHKNIIVQ